MTKKNHIMAALLPGMLLMLLAGSATAHAQSGEYTAYPTYMHGDNKSWIILNGPAGNRTTDFVTLENLSSEPQKISLQVREAENTGGKFLPKETDNFENLGQWINLSQTSYTLAPHEKIRVPITINIPENTPEKQYAGVIYAVKERMDGQNLKIVTRIGVRMYIDVTVPQILQTNIFTGSAYKNSFFFIFSLIGVTASILYQLIYVLEQAEAKRGQKILNKYAKQKA